MRNGLESADIRVLTTTAEFEAHYGNKQATYK
jgi:hypothetical protein